MSRRQSRSNMTVSLFPFLAVLVCAMGALIFLLIATTQMMGDDESETPEVAEVIPLPIPVAPSPFIDVVGYEPPLVDDLDDAPMFVVVEPEIEEPPAPVKVAIPAPPDPNLELKRTVARLRRERERKRRELAKQTEELKAAKKQLATAIKNLDDHRGKLAALKTDHNRIQKQDAAFQAELHQLQLKIDGAKQQIAELKQRHAVAPSKFALIPYDGQRGTTRRPIFIECTENGIKIWPEGVFLGPSQLEGFTDTDNPVLAGVRALTDYWQQKPAPPGVDPPGEPYVLLVVRPQGSIAYYLSKKFLSQSELRYGYELVEEDFDWHLPEADPQAKRALERAVASAIRSRGSVVRKYALGSGPGNLSKFPDLDEERAERDMPFTSHTSNASRFASQRRRQRQRLKNQRSKAEAFGDRASKENGGFSQPGTNSQDSGFARSGTPGGDTRGGRTRSQREGSGQMLGSGQASPNGSQPSRLSPIPGWPQGGKSQPTRELAQRPAGRFSGKAESLFGEPENLPRVPLSGGEKGSTSGREWKPTDPANRNAEHGDQQANSKSGRVDDTGKPGGKSQTAGLPELEPVPTDWRKKAAGKSQTAGNAGRGTSRQRSFNRDAPAVGASSRSVAGQTGQPSLPPLILNRTRTTAQRRNQLAKRGWGQSQKRSGIGIERQVVVNVTTERIVIGDLKTAIGLGHGESTNQVFHAVLADIDEHANSWGIPPQGFYWVPSVRFRVRRDATAMYKAIDTPMRAGGLSTEVEYYREQPKVMSRQGVTR